MLNDGALLIPSSTSMSYKLYSQRFYVLMVFSLLTFNQEIIWITFSPIATSAESYYKFSVAAVDLLLNWGPIIFIPCLFLTYMLLTRQNGLRRCVMLLAVIDFTATVIRVIPSVVTSPSSPNFSVICISLMHAGQILNAICGPLSTTPVSQLSCLWFAPNERTRATTVAVLTHKFGAAVAFLISPAVVSSSEYIPHLLYVHLGLAFVACVLTLLYFPAQPPTAPSAAAELLMSHSIHEQSANSRRTPLKNIWQCLSISSFVLLSIAGGLISGTFSAWTSLFDTILEPEHYTQQQAGWFGFAALISSMVGGICSGVLADTRYFQRRLKTLLIISFTGCFLAVLYFELSVHTIFYDKPILQSTSVTIGLSVAFGGFFYGAALPLTYEAMAEIIFPLPSSLSTAILLQWSNISILVLLFIAPGREKLINLLVMLALGISTIMCCLTRFTYKRRDEDERKQREREHEQLFNGENRTINQF